MKLLGSATFAAVVAGIVAVTGCGRIAFAPTSDAGGDATTPAADAAARVCANPVGHDEDGDGIDDACDGCPHLADPDQIDSDGDGVDDICDPNPTTPGDSIAYFDPFTTQRPEWVVDGPSSNDGESWQIAALGATWTMRRPYVAGNDTFVIGGHLSQIGTIPHQLALGVGPVADTNAEYYCELEDHPPLVLQFTWTYDSMTYQSDTATAISAGLQTGDVLLASQVENGAAACRAHVQGTDFDSIGLVPTGIDATSQGIAFVHVDATLDYFIQIRSGS